MERRGSEACGNQYVDPTERPVRPLACQESACQLVAGSNQGVRCSSIAMAQDSGSFHESCKLRLPLRHNHLDRSTGSPTQRQDRS